MDQKLSSSLRLASSKGTPFINGRGNVGKNGGGKKNRLSIRPR